MAKAQGLLIVMSEDRRVAKMTRVVGDCVGVENKTAILDVAGAEVRLPVHLVRGLDRPDILHSAVARFADEAADDRACLFAAVGEVVDKAEQLFFLGPWDEYTVPAEDYERMADAYARVAGQMPDEVA